MLVPPLTADAKRRGHPPLPVTPNATRLIPNIAYRASGDQRGPRGAAECDRVEELFAVERLPHAAGRAVVHRGAEEIRVNEAAARRVARHRDDRAPRARRCGKPEWFPAR